MGKLRLGPLFVLEALAKWFSKAAKNRQQETIYKSLTSDTLPVRRQSAVIGTCARKTPVSLAFLSFEFVVLSSSAQSFSKTPHLRHRKIDTDSRSDHF